MEAYFTLTSPLYLLLFIPFGAVLFLPRLRKCGRPIALPDGLWLRRRLPRFSLFRLVAPVILSIALASLLLYLAGPVTQKSEEVIIVSSSVEGRKIITVFDASGSTLGKIGDQANGEPETVFSLGRDTLGLLVDARPSDRFALIIFSDRGPYFARGFTSSKEQLLSILSGDPSDKTTLISQFTESTNIAEALHGALSLIDEKEEYSPLVLLISDLGHNAGPFSEVIEALEDLARQGTKVYILAARADSNKLRTVQEYAAQQPAVRVFEIYDAEDFAEANKAINLLEPVVSSSLTSRQVSTEERAKPLLFIAISSLALFGLWQFILRKVP